MFFSFTSSLSLRSSVPKSNAISRSLFPVCMNCSGFFLWYNDVYMMILNKRRSILLACFRHFKRKCKNVCNSINIFDHLKKSADTFENIVMCISLVTIDTVKILWDLYGNFLHVYKKYISNLTVWLARFGNSQVFVNDWQDPGFGGLSLMQILTFRHHSYGKTQNSLDTCCKHHHTMKTFHCLFGQT